MKFEKTGERDGYIILSDKDGNKAEFEFIELAASGGREYAALLQRGDDEFTVMRLDSDGMREIYSVIEDDGEFSAALDALEALIFEEE